MSIRTHCCHSDSFSPWKSPSTNQTPLHLIPKWDRIVSRCHLQGVTGFSFTHFDMPGNCSEAKWHVLHLYVYILCSILCQTSFTLLVRSIAIFQSPGLLLSALADISMTWWSLQSLFVCHVFVCCHSDWFAEWIYSWEHNVGCLGKKKVKCVYLTALINVLMEVSAACIRGALKI